MPQSISLNVVKAAVVVAPQYVAEALQLPPGTPVHERRCVVTRERRGVVEVSTTWSDTAAGSRVAAYARSTASARVASAEDRRDLQLPEPAAVLVNRVTVYDTDDCPILFDEVVTAEGEVLCRNR